MLFTIVDVPVALDIFRQTAMRSFYDLRQENLGALMNGKVDATARFVKFEYHLYSL